MNIDILKCHGSGNDFILIDEISRDYGFSEEDRTEIARKLCDREKSIGADGILYVVKSVRCDAKMRIFNADGTEPEMCGNGIRCVGRYVLKLLNKDSVNIETMKARYNIVKKPELYKGVKTVQATIETIDLDPASLPMVYGKNRLFSERIPELSDRLSFSAVSITNPHVISIVDDIDTEELVDVGSKVNSIKELFPKGANLSFVKIIDENDIYVKTFERGVGLTKSCGTGMISSCIISAISSKVRLNEEVRVYNDGGMIKCVVREKDDDFSVDFMGNASFVFKSTVDFNKDGEAKVSEKIYFEEEKKSYDAFLSWTREYVNRVL